MKLPLTGTNAANNGTAPKKPRNSFQRGEEDLQLLLATSHSAVTRVSSVL